jgi:hypothetical protein
LRTFNNLSNYGHKINILIFFTLSLTLIKAQAPLPINGNKIFKTKTTLRGDNSLIPSPSEKSEFIKILIPEFPHDVRVELIIREYVDGKEIPDDLALILFKNYSKDNKITFELVPDTSDLKHFKLFVYHPESLSARNKFPSENSTFRFYKYQRTDNREEGVKIPLLLIVEDSIHNPGSPSLINPYLINNTLPETVAQKHKLYDKIRRYCIVYYIIQKR